MLTLMIATLVLLLIVYLPLHGGIFARMAGGGLWAQDLVYWAGTNYGAFWGSAASRVPEALLTLPIGFVSAIAGRVILAHFDIDLAWYWSVLWFVVAWNIAYWSFEMGHGTNQGMEGYRVQPGDEGRIDGNERVVRRLLPKDFDITRPLYSWLCMGYKGFCVTLPLGPFALVGAIAFPTGYWLGRIVEPGEQGWKGNHGMAEVFGGLAVMLPTSLVLALLLIARLYVTQL